MTIDSSYKHRLALKLSKRLAKAIETGELPGNEIEDACGMILAAIETMSTEEEVNAFFLKLALCWTFFEEFVEEHEQIANTSQSIIDQFATRQGMVGKL